MNFVQNYWASFSFCHSKPQGVISNIGKELGDDIRALNNMERSYVGWQPPNEECFKINVDASFVESISAASVGVAARDSSGRVIVSS